MTDGTYTGLDDGTILERLTGQAEDLSGDSHSNGSAAGVAGPHGTRSELRARLSTLLRRDEYPAHRRRFADGAGHHGAAAPKLVTVSSR
jgi:hypothetical protein